jgi:hypothetical protein
MTNIIIYKKEKKYTPNRVHKREYKNEKHQVPKENKKYHKIKERKTLTRMRLSPNYYMDKKERKIRNHEKKAKNKSIAQQDHRSQE